MRSPILIVATGARTPVGLTAETTAAAVRAGISRQGEHPFMFDHKGDSVLCAIDGRLDPCLLGWARLVRLAAAALTEIVEKLTHGASWPSLVQVLLALPESRPGFSDADAKHVLQKLQSTQSSERMNFTTESFGRGHAGGLQALAEAARRIQGGHSELCLAGGVDSYFEADTLDWLQSHRQLTGTDVRSGFVPGEGAGFVALGTESVRRQLRLPTLGHVRGTGIAVETKLIKTEAINLGEGLARALLDATRDLRLPEEGPDAIYCDINGERFRTEEWGFTVLRAQKALKDSAYEAPADRWGDVGAACGPLFCNLAVQSWARQYAPGPRALAFAGSEGGTRGVAVLEAP
jgi:3-oxoacyl-[acyl-carrier-protein] synthase I